MKLKFLAITLIALFAATAGKGQAVYVDYNWDAAVLHNITSEEEHYPAVVISQVRFVEIAFVAGQAFTFDTEHKIIHVNNDAGIEKFNKVYIPLASGQLMSLKVRSIDKSGRVTEFNQSNLKELKNVDNYGSFKIFAVEGLAKGGELEYLYTVKSGAKTSGREIMQQDIPIQKCDFELIFPDRFKFLAKSYNGLPKVQNGSVGGKRSSMYVNSTNIPALTEEQYSAYRPSLKRVDYKLESNGINIGLTSWFSISERILQSMDDLKADGKIAKLIKTIDVSNLTEIDKVRKIEQYIKTNFTIKRGGGAGEEDVKSIIDSHVASEQGIAKLYFGIFKQLEIENELVLGSDRSTEQIDPDFSSFSALDDVLFYFARANAYLVPGTSFMRLGTTSSALAGSNALFIKYYFEKSKATYLSYRVNEITPTDYTVNQEGVKATITFDDNLVDLSIKQQNFWQGYRGIFYRGVYNVNDEKDREEFIKDVTLSAVEDFTLNKRTMEGENVELSSDPVNFFRVNTDYKAMGLVEKADNDYLLSVGKIIGKQSELYQETERQTDIVFHEISNYNHEIVVEIPKGFTCSGLEAIKIDNKVIQNGNAVMYFKSDYTIDGSILTIKANEVYKTLNLPKGKYEEFRKMVNSAADFNKIVLVFQPASAQ